MHRLHRVGDAKHQNHETLLREAGVVDEIRIDGILQVSALVVGQQHVDGLGAGITAVGAELGPRLGGDTVVDRMDDVLMPGKQVVGFDFLQGLGNGFLAERTSDLLQRE